MVILEISRTIYQARAKISTAARGADLPPDALLILRALARRAQRRDEGRAENHRAARELTQRREFADEERRGGYAVDAFEARYALMKSECATPVSTTPRTASSAQSSAEACGLSKSRIGSISSAAVPCS